MNDILEQIKSGEASRIQFKERILDRYDIGCELVAFSNARGGKLVVGIKDKTGSINALSYSEVQQTTNLLSDIASENVVPSILITVETISVEDGSLVVATIKEGLNKPYHDNKGIVWVKQGADKRKVFDNAELAEMMTDCGSFAPDESGVRDASINDLDSDTDSDTKSGDLDTKLRHSDTDLDTFEGDSDTDLVTNLDTKTGDLVTQLSYSGTDLDTKLGYHDGKREPLTKKQQDIVNFCSVPRTATEIMQRLGLSNQTKNREHYITSLVAAGYLQMTNPDNPRASNQKYKSQTIKL